MAEHQNVTVAVARNEVGKVSKEQIIQQELNKYVLSVFVSKKKKIQIIIKGT